MKITKKHIGFGVIIALLCAFAVPTSPLYIGSKNVTVEALGGFKVDSGGIELPVLDTSKRYTDKGMSVTRGVIAFSSADNNPYYLKGGYWQSLVGSAAGGTVSVNSTLTGTGSSGSPLGIDLAVANTWTASGPTTFEGNVTLGKASNQIGKLTLKNQTNSNYVTLQAPVSVTGTYALSLPAAAPSVNNAGILVATNGAMTYSYSGQITGATGTSATATIPSGMTNCILSMKNETHPTAPYTTDVIIVTPIWNISGTTLTVYFKQTGGGLTDSYTISYTVW